MTRVLNTIDIPIKLTFEGSRGSNIIGLDNIILPGIFICFALRFYLHWSAKASTGVITGPRGLIIKKTAKNSYTIEGPRTTVATRKKTIYLPATGLLCDRVIDLIWHILRHLHIIKAIQVSLDTQPPAELLAVTFNRPYFWTSTTGYR